MENKLLSRKDDIEMFQWCALLIESCKNCPERDCDMLIKQFTTKAAGLPANEWAKAYLYSKQTGTDFADQLKGVHKETP